jgi:hypothetical protein
MDVRQFLENLRIIQRGVAIGHLDLSPALERRKHHEQLGGAVALILIIIACGSARLGRDRLARLDNKLL